MEKLSRMQNGKIDKKVKFMSSFISLENVKFVYDEQVLFEDLSLSIEEGSFVALLGRNGSGKSTIARLMNGLNQPSKGTVTVDGMDAANEDTVFEVRSRVGLVFQNPDNQIVGTIVEEDVAFGPENLGVSPDEIRRRVDDALAAVNMSEYKSHAPHRLSGGQKQRVAIAGVLAMQPKCIVLDEPTAMLDPSGRREVMDTILQLNRQEGITIVLITHFMDEASVADRVVLISGGRIEADGAAEDVLTDVDTLKSCGLDMPQPAELLYLLQKGGLSVSEMSINVDGCVDIISAALREEGAV